MQRALWISLKNNLSLKHGMSPAENKHSYQDRRKAAQHCQTRHMYKYTCPLLKFQLVCYTWSHDRLSGVVNCNYIYCESSCSSLKYSAVTGKISDCDGSISLSSYGMWNIDGCSLYCSSLSSHQPACELLRKVNANEITHIKNSCVLAGFSYNSLLQDAFLIERNQLIFNGKRKKYNHILTQSPMYVISNSGNPYLQMICIDLI